MRADGMPDDVRLSLADRRPAAEDSPPVWGPGHLAEPGAATYALDPQARAETLATPQVSEGYSEGATLLVGESGVILDELG